MTTIDEIQSVCFVGAGTMGCYNSLVAALAGYDAILFDVDSDCLGQVTQRQNELAALMINNGVCSAEAIPTALPRISRASDLKEATKNADLVSESVFERLDVKRDTHRQLDEVCPHKTILTTNSSTMLVSEIESSVSRGDRFAALHSHLGSPLVDIVGGPRTSAATIDILNRYVQSIRGVPLVLKKEHPGYVLNAMIGSLLRTSLRLVVDGDAKPEDVDRAWMSGRDSPMGPFGMIDYFGVNLVFDSWKYRDADADIVQLRSKILKLLQPLVDRHELGVKSGKGFYDYPAPLYQSNDFLDTKPKNHFIYDALESAWIASAVLVAKNDVADPVDIDRAWTVGTFLDSGPFQVLRKIGTAHFLNVLADQVAAGRFSGDQSNLVSDYLLDTTCER